MSMERVRQYLDEQNIKYSILQHSPAYTAQEVAESVHVTGRHFAKCVMVKIDGRLAQVVRVSRIVKSGRCRPSVIFSGWRCSCPRT